MIFRKRITGETLATAPRAAVAGDKAAPST